ncbi:MAG: NADH:flavin oxidoreductase [Thalassospira sp.]|uniref:NADH:flavin oxidoreductase n=1 Tax=Thalassospira sp. TaxID=1912094 RepID=UPI0032ED8309
MSNTDILFQPFKLKSLELSNRIVMAPMTRSSAPNGIPGAANAEYYRKRAQGGVGLILSEGTVINRPASRNEPDIPLFYGADALAGWKGVIDAVHGAGGKMGPQLWHTGSVKSSQTEWVPDAPVESPSGLVAPNDPRGNTMSDADIADTISAFAQAALDAKNAGFDTFEIHGAHGYLIDQFFWSGTNLRTDRFGGKTIGERSTFAVEVVRAIRAAVGPDFPIIMRISQFKQQDLTVRLANTPDEMTAWLGPLVDAGVDIIHASQRRFWEPEFPELDGQKGLNCAGWAKKLTGAATISVGSVGLSGDILTAFAGEGSRTTGLDELLTRMERNEFDLIAVGRALITDAQWAAKVRDNQTDALLGFDPATLGELV